MITLGTAKSHFRELGRLLESAEATDAGCSALDLGQALEAFRRFANDAHARGNKLIFVGNGGSAAIASHMAIDFSKNGNLRALALNDGAALTCLGNDLGYAKVFAHQIGLLAQAGDLLVAISSSGRSPNILEAVAAARTAGCAVVTLSGFAADNPLRALGDINFYLGSGEYGFVEVGHLMLCHTMLDLHCRLRDKPAMEADRPRQAVILAGGKGTRLRHLTADRPKPMVDFHGRPFLEYLIDMLRDQGFERVLLLLGYKAEQVMEHFGDGSRFGVAIEYSVSDVEDETGERLRKAKPSIEPQFLLAYCDNYWPMDFRAMWREYRARGALAQVTVYANEDGYTRDNLIVDQEGFLSIYDKSRSTPGLKGVDIGFILADHAILDLIPEGNASFEASVYPALVARRQLAAHVTRHRYYSVGTVERLPVTAEFLARRPTVILDRDGVLNSRMGKGEYVRSWSEWTWLPTVREGLARLAAAGVRTIVVTNQAGIARGAMSAADLEDIHRRMREEAEQAGGRIDAIYHCPHGWDEGCSCRKPKPGMLFQAQRDFHLDLSRTWFIGDDTRDAEAATAAGCRFAMAGPDKPLGLVLDEILPLS